MSLDGFIAGPGGDMQWLAKHLAESNPEAAALMEDIGALLVGANTASGGDPDAGTDKGGERVASSRLLGDGCRRAYGRRHVDEGRGQEHGGDGDAEQGEAAERER
jgi:hypothetical protein